MRVALLNYACSDPGIDPRDLVEGYRTLTGWADALHARGAKVGVFQGATSDALWQRNGVDYCSSRGAFVTDLSRWRIPRRLHHTVRRWRPDVVHLNGLTYPLQTLHLRHCLGPSVALVAQHHGAEPMRGWRRLVQRRALAATNGVLFCGLGLANHWTEACVLPPHTPAWSVPESSSLLGAPADDDTSKFEDLRGHPSLVWLGHLDRNKEPLVVLDGVALAVDRLPNLKLMMAYRSAPLIDTVRRRIADDDRLRGRVHLLGTLPHDHVGSLLACADILVQGSRREGSGYAVIEALSRGVLPVITDIPSFHDLTDGGRIGGLWSVGNADELARTLVRVARASSPQERRTTIVWFNHHLSWPMVARRAMAAYRAARCGQRRAKRG